MCDDDQALAVLYAVVAVKSPTEPVRALAQYVAAAGNFQKVALALRAQWRAACARLRGTALTFSQIGVHVAD